MEGARGSLSSQNLTDLKWGFITPGFEKKARFSGGRQPVSSYETEIQSNRFG